MDSGIIFHMLKNNAPVKLVAKHVGVHRDTLYANYREVIEGGRASHSKEWGKIMDVRFAEFLERKRLKEKARKRRLYLWYLSRKR